MSEQSSTKRKKRWPIRTGLPGDVHGKWTILGEAESLTSRKVSVRCECGALATVFVGSLRQGTARRCNVCTVRPASASSNIAWACWASMKRRCESHKHKSYHRYGGRGVTVCAAWTASFLAFIDDVGPRPSKDHSIGRIDNEGHYEPGNVRWETRLEQGRNKHNTRRYTFEGRTMLLEEWAISTGLPSRCIAGRIAKGWSVEQALTRPLSALGGQNRCAKLRPADVVKMRQLLRDGATCKAMSVLFRVSVTQVHRIKQGKCWPGVT